MNKSVIEEFITEIVHDFVQEELDKIFGAQKWSLEMEGMKDMDNYKELPSYLWIFVMGTDGDEIGEIEVSTYDYFEDVYSYPAPKYLWKVSKYTEGTKEVIFNYNNRNIITEIKKLLEQIVLHLDSLGWEN